MRILITGASGFIGSELTQSLKRQNHDIIELNKSKKNGGHNINLLCLNDINFFLNTIGNIDLLIHCAALAHGQKPSRGYNIYSENYTITKNLVISIADKIDNVIFLSSFDIYGIGKKHLKCEPNPVSLYGKSKLDCEKLFINSNFNSLNILRLAPVFSEKRNKDLLKRVYLPIFKIFKMKIIPQPEYNLLKVGKLVDYINDVLIKSNLTGCFVHNLSDDQIYLQNEMSRDSKGIDLPIYAKFLYPIYLIAKIFPLGIKYKILEPYYKLIITNLAKNEKIEIINK